MWSHPKKVREMAFKKCRHWLEISRDSNVRAAVHFNRPESSDAMPSTSVNGNSIHYELHGHAGPAIVLTPGGRSPLTSAQPLAKKLADSCRVLLWDRPNLGSSDLCFSGASDLEMWTDQLHELLRRLDFGPAVFVAASSGARLSMKMALRYPEDVSALFLWLLSGGAVAKQLAFNYYGESANVAEQAGMTAVAKLPYWAARIQANPANRARILTQNPNLFAATMRRWANEIREDQPIIGLQDGELERIRTKTRVVAGSDNTSHRRDRMEHAAACIPGAELIDPPGFREEWLATRQASEIGTGFESISQLPSLILDFVTIGVSTGRTSTQDTVVSE
ncbi:2-hydroxy-6-oxononadienedioate/2-hydroxy-6-oxononatrienedioate hydrolase [compost metagenome]